MRIEQAEVNPETNRVIASMEDSTRGKIIKATLRLMGRKEGREIPVREILAEAGLSNMSAVSYHFGSKENLIKQALQWYYDEMYSVLTTFQAIQSDDKGALLQLAEDFWAFISSNPGLEQSMLIQMIKNKKPDPDFQRAMQRNMAVVKQLIQKVTGIKTDKVLNYRAIAFMSGIVYPFLLRHYADKTLGFDTEEVRQEYLNNLVEGVVR